MNRFKLIILALSALMVVQCKPDKPTHSSKPTQQDQSIQQDKLIGSWQLNAGLFVMSYSYSKDKTYIATVAGVENASENGKWERSDKFLVITPEYSSMKPANVGKKMIHEILEIDDNSLKTKIINEKTGKTEFMIFQRLK